MQRVAELAAGANLMTVRASSPLLCGFSLTTFLFLQKLKKPLQARSGADLKNRNEKEGKKSERDADEPNSRNALMNKEKCKNPAAIFFLCAQREWRKVTAPGRKR